MLSTTRFLNKEALAYYLTYQFVPKPFHLKLKPKIKKQLSIYRFPKSQNQKKTLKQNEQQIAKGLYAHLNYTIKTSLKRSNGPLGLLLSGGLDSTILLYLLRKNTNQKIYTISSAYVSDKSHLKLCSFLAKKYNTIHQELIISPSDLLKLADLYSNSLEAPIGDNGFLTTHLMLKKLSSHTNTVYTGDGADCLFHGLKAHYLNFLDHHYLRRFKSGTNISTMITKKLLSPKNNYPDYEHYKYDEIFLTQDEARQYLNMDFDLTKPLKAIKKTIRTNDSIKKTILLDLNFLVVNRVDYILQAAAANKINITLPFLKQPLIDYVLRIPSQYFIKDHEQKYILKKTFANNLPKEVISQKKRGMTPPFREWYAKNQSFVLKTLNQAPSLGVSSKYIRHLLENIDRSHQYAYGMRIWLILNLVLWHNGQHN